MKMRAISIFCVATVLIGLTEIAWGHFPPGLTLLAFQWPEGYEPVMDGDLGEWDIVPEQYVLETQDLCFFRDDWSGEPYDCQRGDTDLGSLDISRCIVGWSKAENKLYFAAHVWDDVHRIDPSWPKRWGGENDRFQIMIDADHSGGKYDGVFSLSDEEWKALRGAQATQYIIVAGVDERPFIAYNYGTWMEHSPWAEYGCKVQEDPTGGQTITYEVVITPFDNLYWKSPEQSVLHNLQEGEVIGLGLGFSDEDDDVRGLEGYYSLTGSARSYRLAEELADLWLSPVDESIFKETLIEDTTWGRIKSTFRR